ncbi:MAG: hypothetical protein ACRCT1_12400 [Microcoleaceae cyanobacterium]
MMKVYVGGGARLTQIEWGYPDCLGNLFSPGKSLHFINPVYSFCLDNGAFRQFNPLNFVRFLDKVQGKPDFIVCPDVVGDAPKTRDRWDEWNSCLREFNCPIAFCLQDGQRPEDLPLDADFFFLGGSDLFRSRFFCQRRKWPKSVPLHIGRVNTWAGLWRAYQAGATSCDATGWFRKSSDHWSAKDLLLFLKVQKGEIAPIAHPSWPYISLKARQSLLSSPWSLSREPLFFEG